MKILLRILLILVLLVVVLWGVGYMLPPRAGFEREITVSQPLQFVYDDLLDIRGFNFWSPWVPMDPNAKYTFSENTVGVGASLAWDGNKDVGKGTSTITEVSSPDMIRILMVFLEGDEKRSEATSVYRLEDTADGTRVRWSFEIETPGVLDRYYGLMLGISPLPTQYEQGLANYKEYIEKRTVERGIDMDEVQLEALPVMGVRGSYVFSEDNIGEKMNAAFLQIGEFMQRNSIDEGRMISVYFSDASQGNPPPSVDFLAGVITEQVDNQPNSGVEPYTIPSGTYIRGIHLGSYDNLAGSHQQIGKYIQSEGLQLTRDIWEEYIVTPAGEADEEKWVTHLYYRVEAGDTPQN